MTETSTLIAEQIKAIPKGKVSTYGRVAKAAGFPNGARLTVWVLHSLSEKCGLPWHRVIRSDGTLALEGEGRKLQTLLLESEGVDVSEDGRVDLKHFGF